MKLIAALFSITVGLTAIIAGVAGVLFFVALWRLLF